MALRIAKALSAEQTLRQAEQAFDCGAHARAVELLLTLPEGTDPLPYKLLSYALLKLDRLEEALLAATRVIERAPFEGAGFNLVGVVLHRCGQYTAAERFFRRVLELEPEHPEARMSVVDCLRRRGEAVSADLDPILAFLDRLPQGSAAQWTEWGIQAYEKQLFPRALECFFAALEQTPDTPDLFRYLGMIFLEQGAADKAMVAVAQSIRLAPQEAQGFNMMGVLLTRLGEGKLAKRFFERTLLLDPEHPIAGESLQHLKAVESGAELGEVEALLELWAPRISLCLIAKNEEKFLEGCLKSVQGAVDEIVLVDTGSTDRTVEIAEAFGAKVFHFPWCNDFAAARNESLLHATGDWALVLDADERLDPESIEELRRRAWCQKIVSYGIVIDNLLGDNEEQGRRQTAVILRFFKNRPDMRFEGRIHEQIIQAAQRTGLAQRASSIRVLHLGYLKETMTERDKNQRNLKLLRDQVEADPQNPYAHFNLGQTYRMEQDWEKAEKHYQESLRLLKERQEPLETPYYLTLYLNYALQYLDQKRWQEALDVCREARPLFPDYPDLAFAQGMAFMETGELSAAIAAFEEAIRGHGRIFAAGSDPGATSHKAYQALGICHFRLDHHAEARRYFQQALKTGPKPDAEPHLNLGIVDLQEGRLQEALGHFADALEIAPDHPQTLKNSSYAFLGLGMVAEALAMAQKAATLHPDFPEVHLLLSEALLAAGRTEEALVAAEREWAAHATSGARLNVGLAKLLLGDPAGCRAAWNDLEEPLCFLDWLEERPVELPPSSNWLPLVRQLLKAGKHEWLERIVRDADRLATRMPDLSLQLGQLFMEANLTEWSITLLLALREKQPENPQVFYLLGEDCLQGELVQDARLMFEQALRLAPAHIQARRRLLALA